MDTAMPLDRFAASGEPRGPDIADVRSWLEAQRLLIGASVPAVGRYARLPSGHRFVFPSASSITTPAEALSWSSLAHAQGVLLRRKRLHSPGSKTICVSFFIGALVSLIILLVSGDQAVDLLWLALLFLSALASATLAFLIVAAEGRVETWEMRAFEYRCLAEWWQRSGCIEATVVMTGDAEPDGCAAVDTDPASRTGTRAG